MEEPPFRLVPSVVWIVGIRELGLIFQTKDFKQHHHSSRDPQDTRAQLISPSSSPPFTSRDKKVAKVATFCKLNAWPDGHSERNLCFFSAKLTSKFPIKSNSSKLNPQWGNVCVGDSIQVVRQWCQKGSVVVLPLSSNSNYNKPHSPLSNCGNMRHAWGVFGLCLPLAFYYWGFLPGIRSEVVFPQSHFRRLSQRRWGISRTEPRGKKEIYHWG